MLGQALQQGAADYANRRLSLADEQRRRGERLGDVAADRAYQEGQFDRVRGLQLADEQRRREEAMGDTQRRALMQNRFEMLQEAQKRGLIDAAQIGNQAAEDAALSVLGQALEREAKRAAEQPVNAESALSDIGLRIQNIEREMAEVDASVSAAPTINPAAIKQRAVAIATANNGGKVPSREQIAEAEQAALEEAQQQAFIQWNQNKQNAQVRQQVLASQLNALRQQQATIIGTFRVAPKPATPIVAPAAAVAPSKPAGDPMTGFMQQLTPPPAPPPPPAQPMQDFGFVRLPVETPPTDRQRRTLQLADAYAKADAPLAARDAELAAVNSQIQRLLTAPAASESIGRGGQTLYASPEQKSKEMTRLLQQKASIENLRTWDEKDRRTNRSNSLLQLNLPSLSMPLTVPSPGSLLSTR